MAVVVVRDGAGPYAGLVGLVLEAGSELALVAFHGFEPQELPLEQLDESRPVRVARDDCHQRWRSPRVEHGSRCRDDFPHVVMHEPPATCVRCHSEVRA